MHPQRRCLRPLIPLLLLARALPTLAFIHTTGCRRIHLTQSAPLTSRWLATRMAATSNEETTSTAIVDTDRGSQAKTAPTATKRALCTDSDRAILKGILSEIKVQPPWASPECSARTFNYVLAALLGSYNSTLSHSTSNKPNQRQPSNKALSLGPRTEEVLRYMIRECRQRPEIAPNTVTLNTVMAAYTKSMGRDKKFAGSRSSSSTTAMDRASALATVTLLHTWQDDWYKEQIVSENVDLVSYNTAMSACAKAGLPDQAQELFAELQALYERTRDARFRPDIISYNCVLNALAIAGQTDRVGDLFRLMRTEGPAPTIHSYNDVLYAYSKSSHPEHAESFLSWWLLEEERLLQDEDANSAACVRPLTHSYNIVLHAMAQMQRPDALRRARKLFYSMPSRDAISYTTMIAAVCKQQGKPSTTSTTQSSASRVSSAPPATFSSAAALDSVRDILQLVWQDHASNMMTVDAAFVSNVLFSLATVDDKAMPTFAEALVQDSTQKGVVLDIRVYNGLIHCWAKSNSRDSGDRVLEVLSTVEQDSSLSPDARTYTSVLDALKTSRSADFVTAAEDIVDRMETIGPAPTVATYTALILIYARSRLGNKAVLATRVLERMKQPTPSRDTIVPNLISYNAVLNACEHTMVSSDRIVMEECLRVACATFDAVRNSAPAIKANHVTYASFLGTLANFMPPDTRHELVALVFRRCCAEGQASHLVLRKLRNAVVTEDRYRLLLEGHDEAKLPTSWNCHVRDVLARQQ